ncbi:MAG: regulatory protein RecX [bacterium]
MARDHSVDKGDKDAALKVALKLLARRAYSERRLSEKLRDKGFNETVIREVLAACRRKNFVNDRDFAKNFVERRLETRPRAGHVLIGELLKQGISLRLAREVVEEHVTGEIESQSAKVMAMKKWKQFSPLGADVCFRRVSSYLARRGYNWDAISEAIKQARTALQKSEKEE